MAALLLWLALQDSQEDEIRKLVDLLGSDSVAEREGATEKLIEIGEPARKHLQPLAEKSESELQERARFILSRIDAKARREALLKRGAVSPELLKRDPDLVDRIVSTKSEDRERAFEDLTGISMGELRRKHEGLHGKRRYCLPSLTHQALLAEFPELIREIFRIGARDPVRGRSAYVMLWPLDSPFLRKELLASLDDPDSGMRGYAARACGLMGISEATQRLERLLKDGDRIVVEDAIYSLGDLRSGSSAPAIAGLLNHEAPSIRESAMDAVARLGYRDAVPMFRTLLRQKPEDENQLGAAYALSQFPDPVDLDLWIDLSKEDDENLREAAVQALDKIPGERSNRALAAMLGDPDTGLLVPSARSLARRGVRGVADDVEAAVHRVGEESFLAAQLVHALRDLPDEDREARFRRLLRDGGFCARTAALDSIGYLRLNALAQDVVGRLKAEDGIYAAAALLRLEFADSAALRRLLPKLSSPGVHRILARKIVRIEAAQEKGRLLSDSDPEIRRAALAELGKEMVQGMIASMLADGDPGVAAAAVRRARKSNLREIAPKLVALLDEKTSASLFSEAVRTLGVWNVREAIPRLIPFLPNDDIEGTVATALGRLNAVEAENEILKLLDTIDVAVAGKLRLTKALVPLRERMVLYGGSERGRGASSAYVAIRCGEDAAKVESMLQDRDEMTRIGAIRQLRELGYRSAVQSLRERLDDPSRDVAVEAARLLVRWGDKTRKTLRFVKDVLGDRELWLDLNALRNPEAHRALTSRELEPWIGGEFSTSHKAALYEDPLGMEVRISPSVSNNFSTSMKDSTFATAEDLLWDVPVLLEKDRIVVVDWEEAERFWNEWIDRELKE